MTDAISPEFRLEPKSDAGFIPNEWHMDDANALMLHQPTHALFSIYLAPGTDPAAPSIFDFRARLCHVCDGFPVPADLATLGAAAINGFALFTERFDPLECATETNPIAPQHHGIPTTQSRSKR